MWPILPPYLQKVLELVVMGYMNADIGKEIGHPTERAADYVRRLIQEEKYFKGPVEKLMAEHGYSSRTALAQVGRQYLTYHASHANNVSVENVDISVSEDEESNLLGDMQNLREGSYSLNPQEYRNQLIRIGDQLTKQFSWEEAIPYYRQAETAFGKGFSNQAAWAACSVLYLLIDLGDYDEAQKEARRIQRTYGSVMDYETKAEFYKLRGWLNYYQGNFARAEKWLNGCLQLAQETGVPELGESAQHFLGRLYSDWAQAIRRGQDQGRQEQQEQRQISQQQQQKASVNRKRKTEGLLHQSAEAFDEALRLHRH